MYVNSVAVVGNLTADPLLREGDNKVVNFRIGVNKRVRSGQENESETRERTDFLDVECWGPQAVNIESSLKKGDRAIVVGQLKYDQWSDSEGNLRSRVRVRASAVGHSLEFRELTV